MTMHNSDVFSHHFGSLIRLINRLNPTSYGRKRLESFAVLIAGLPRNGIYKVGKHVTMRLDIDDILERHLFFGSFEYIQKKIIIGFLHPGGTFLDIGANLGYYSLLASEKLGPSGKIMAFEPNPIIFRRLKENIQINKISMIEAFNFALSDSEGEAFLFTPEVGSHGLSSIKDQVCGKSTKHCIKTKRLDDILPNDIGKIDCIKMDVEGAELPVLRGAERIIKAFKPNMVLEINREAQSKFGYSPLDLVEFLQKANPNYTFYIITHHRVHRMSLSMLMNMPMDTNLLCVST